MRGLPWSLILLPVRVFLLVLSVLLLLSLAGLGSLRRWRDERRKGVSLEEIQV